MKTYLENEMDELNKQEKCEKRHEKMRNTLQMKKCLLIVFVSFTLLLTSYANSELYVKCDQCCGVQALTINCLSNYGVFPNTWTCQNISCGYKNYEAIQYCGLCGTKRGEYRPR